MNIHTRIQKLLIVINILFHVVQSTNVFFVHTSMERVPGLLESCAIERPVEVNEENERQVKNSCFPWTRLDLVRGVRVRLLFFCVTFTSLKSQQYYSLISEEKYSKINTRI